METETQPQTKTTLTMTSVNTTDATRGQLLGERVLARKAELEAALAALDEKEAVAREALETALATATELTTGDIESPTAATAASMNKWLESNKHLAGGDVPAGTSKNQGPVRKDQDGNEGAPTKSGPQPHGDLADKNEVDINQLNDGDARGGGPQPGGPGEKLPS